MNDAGTLIFLAVLVLGGVIGLILYYRWEKARTEALPAAAAKIGFTYKEYYGLGPEFQEFKLFNRDQPGDESNVMLGTRGGYSFTIFDYRFKEGSGKHSSTNHQTVAYVQLKRSDLPQFVLEPEHIFHKIGEKFGSREIDFKHFPGFSDFYRLQGENEAEIRTFFKSRLLEYFQGKKLFVTIESGGRNSLIMYQLGKRIKPDELDGFVEQFREIISYFERI